MIKRQRPLRILVVDDNADEASSLAMLLQAYGFKAESCDYSRNCMAIVEQKHPDVLLLDLMMPGMTGFDIAEELELNPHLRPRCLIAVTGHDDQAYRDRTKASGFHHHLLKPIDLDELKSILDSVP